MEAVAGNERILGVLHELATQSQPCGVRELAQKLEASRSTVSRALLALADQGIAMVTPQGNYTAGPRLRVLMAALHQRHPVLAAAPDVIAKLSEQTNSTVLAAVHDAPRPRVVVLATHRHPGPVKYLLEPGVIVPLHAGATGRSILGVVGLQALGDGKLEARTSDTVVDRGRIAALLDEDRRRGYTVSIGQQFPLAAGAAVPFTTAGLNGSISITRPRFDTTDEDLHRFAPWAQQAARNIEHAAASVPTPDGPPITHPDGTSATERIIRFLTAVATHPMGVSTGRALAPRIRANIATTERLVASAITTGLVTLVQDRLVAGPRLLHWAACLGPVVEIAGLARNIMRSVAERTGETIGLARLDDEARMADMTAVVDGARALHYGLAEGVSIPLHAGAAGKAILAHCPSEWLDGLALEPLTGQTLTDRGALTTELAAIRSRGWATGNGERIPDAFGVSAPYFIGDTIAGSITATVSRQALPDLDVERLAAAIVDAAGDLTRLLTV